MLVIRLELWPGGDEKRKREIGHAEVWNVSDLADVSDYWFEVRAVAGDNVGARQLYGKVKRHTRSLGAWELVRRVRGRRL